MAIKEPKKDKGTEKAPEDQIYDKTNIGPYKTKVAQMKQEVSTYRPHWKNISDIFLPERGKYLDSPDNDNKARKKTSTSRSKIINGTTEDAVRIVGAGMQGGMTSPAYPWFELSLADKDLAKYGPVKAWLFEVRDRLLNAFSRSNFYGSMHGQYLELAAFGTSAMMIEEDFNTAFRFRPYTIGEYMLAIDDTYRVDTLCRQFRMTARMMVTRFGWDKVSEKVKVAIRSSNPETMFEVVSFVSPNDDYIESRADIKGKKYKSVYYEVTGNNDQFLGEEGYRVKPFVGPRWDVVGINVYGDGAGSMALGDGRMLQKEEEKKLKGLDKLIDPPMNATTDLKKKGGSIISGGVNYFDAANGATGFAPAYQINPDFQSIAHEINTVETRIRRFFFNDLFLSILGTDKRMTATEVAERHEEKLQLLGPVLDRLQTEQLDPIIDRGYDILDDLGAIPEAPPELEGVNLNIVYVSMLARAQKRVETESIERMHGFIERVTVTNPQAIYKMNYDKMIDDYGESIGLPPGEIVATEDANAARAADQAKALQQQQRDAATGMANSAKTLSEAETKDGNMLDRLIEQAPAGAGANLLPQQ